MAIKKHGLKMLKTVLCATHGCLVHWSKQEQTLDLWPQVLVNPSPLPPRERILAPLPLPICHNDQRFPWTPVPPLSEGHTALLPLTMFNQRRHSALILSSLHPYTSQQNGCHWVLANLTCLKAPRGVKQARLVAFQPRTLCMCMCVCHTNCVDIML